MRKNFFLGLMATALLLAAGSAFAIGEQYGRVTGIVYDQNGAVLPGVKLTLTSGSLLGGPRSLNSDKEGGFTFNNLPPGKYDLLVEQPGLKTINKKDVIVSTGKTASLYLIMELPTATDTVTVVAERPVVDTTNMTQGGSFSADLAGDVPTARSYQDIASLLPGVVDVRGGNPDIHGGTFRNNRYLVDGLDITDPVTLTFSANINFDSIQEVEVLTGGLDAEYNALGGIINVVTKSGGNDFELDASYYINNKTLSPQRQFGEDVLSGPLKFQPVDATIFAQRQFNVNAGGPIIKDKLWYYVSVERVSNFSSAPVGDPFFIALPPRDFEGTFLRGKLTFQPNQNNTFTAAYSMDPTQIFNNDNGANRPLRFVDPSCANDPEGVDCLANNTQTHRTQGGFFTSLRWDRVLSSNLLFKAQAGFSTNTLIGFPENPLFNQVINDPANQGQVDAFGNVLDPLNFVPQARRDRVTAARAGISDTNFVDGRTHLQGDAVLTFLKDNFFGSHEFKTGIQAAPTINNSLDATNGYVRFDDRANNGAGGSGFEFIPLASGGFKPVSLCNSIYDPLTRTTKFPDVPRTNGCSRAQSNAGANPFENPTIATSRSLDAGIFIQDEWKPTPFFTIKPGFRFDTFTSANLNDLNADGDFADGDETDLDENVRILTYSGIGPRLGMAWDPTHDGKTVLSAYVGQVTESGNLVIPGFAGRSTLIQVYNFNGGLGVYDFVNPLVSFGGAAGTILACDPKLKDDPLTADLFEDCRPPVMREFSFKAERQIGDATVLGLNGTFRRQFHMFEDDEANLIFDERGINVIGGFNGNSNVSVFRLRTPDEAFVSYAGVDLYLQGKPSERSNIFASYTLSSTFGSKDEDTNTQFTFFMDNPRQNAFNVGPLPSNRPHVIKVVASYDFDFGLQVGANYVYQSGQRFDRFFDSPALGDFVDRRAPRGFDPGTDVNDPSDDVALQLPDFNQLDLRMKYSLAPLTGQKIEFIADVFNVFNLGTVTSVDETDDETADSSFKLVNGRQTPLQVQFGLRYVY